MIDFAKLELGIIKGTDGFYIIIKGRIHGPISEDKLNLINKLVDEQVSQ